MSVTEDKAVAARFFLRMLGSPSVTVAGGESVPGLGPGKPLALLCYLARTREARREELTTLLWGSVDEARARNAFRQSLHRLRQALDGILVQSNDRLQLDEHGPLWCDVTAFEEALSAGDVDQALELYRGDFLEGLILGEHGFDHWADLERARLGSRYRAALEIGVRAAVARADWQLATSRSERLVETAPYDGSAVLLLASTLEAAGRGSEVPGVLEAYSARCEELGIEPAADVIARPSRPAASGTPAPSSPRIDRPHEPGSLFGRNVVLGNLNRAWESARGGVGQLVVLSGEAGSGKTRVLDEFARSLAVLDRPLVLRGRDMPGASLPYASIAEALRGTSRAPGLAGASEHLLAEAARIVPEIRDRFKLPQPGPIADDAARLRFFEGVAAVLEAVSYEQPVCLLLDGLEYGAPVTFDLVRYLATRLRGCAILIVATGTSRVADRLVPGGPGESGRGAGIFRMDLEPLTDADAAALVASLPEAAAVSHEDQLRIVGMGAGNPLRLTELTRHAAAGVPLTAPLVTLSDVLSERLEAQPATHRRLFLAAALLGRPAPLRVLAASAHLSEPATLDATLALEDAGLLVQSPEGAAPAHSIVAELAIEKAGAAGRTLIAGWAADALAAEQPKRAAELADLYGRAGRVAEAYRYSRLAADEALRVGAFREAQSFLERALEFAPDEAAAAEIRRELGAFGGGTLRLDPGPAPKGENTGRIFTTYKWLIPAALGIAIIAIALVFARSARQRPVGHVIGDTVLLVETESPGDNRFFAFTGQVASAARLLLPADPVTPGPAWLDSVQVPWMNPRVSPDGRFVTVERMRESGPDLFAISANRADTVAVATGDGDDFALDWAPDGSALLVSRSRIRGDGSYDTDLYLFRLSDRILVPVDTSLAREVASAAWSPAGTHLMWTARVRTAGQRDLYVSRADGSGVVNLSRHPADDYQPTWAPDGTRMVFTSERDGNPELYSAEVANASLARLTFNDAEDNRAAFSPDGRFIAFESVRDGERAVYVMASRGGQPARVSPASRRMTLAGWRGRMPGFVQGVRLAGAESIVPGDSLQTLAEAVLSDGSIRTLDEVELESLDQGVRIRSGTAGSVVVTGIEQGIFRVRATLPGWRTDTLFVKVGSGAIPALVDDFQRGPAFSDAWVALGSRGPRTVAAAGENADGILVPRAEPGRQSGLLSAASFPVSFGLSMRARVLAPFAESHPATLVLALVERPGARAVNADAPSFLPLASVTWVGEARRIAYAVGREVMTEPVSAVGDAAAYVFEIRVENDGHVAFFVDGKLRWRSTLRLGSAEPVSQVNVWLGGQSLRDDAGIDHVQLLVGDLPAQ